MKKIFKNINLYILICVFVCLFSSQILLASSTVPFEYNIIPQEANNSIIDTKNQKQINFRLYKPMNNIYYNGNLITLKDNTFSIDISALIGEKTITFTDDNNQTVSFSYYFSDKKGKVENYELVKGKNLITYVTTFNNIKIIYSSKEKACIKRLTSYLKKLPTKLLENVETITLIPYETKSNIAGITKDNSITLYKFSKYSSTTQKNILYHEIAHTWATKLMEEKIIDYSYSDYSQVVKNDNNYVSNYSKSYIKDHSKYSEDFADSVSFFYIKKSSFKRKYPYRYEYINNLVNLKIEEDD